MSKYTTEIRHICEVESGYIERDSFLWPNVLCTGSLIQNDNVEINNELSTEYIGKHIFFENHTDNVYTIIDAYTTTETIIEDEQPVKVKHYYIVISPDLVYPVVEGERINLATNGFNNVHKIINAATPKMFNFDFPIFDETYRLPLETKIIRHFYTREICEETVGLWKLRLCDKLNMIMPYYNKLYNSALLEFNPFLDVDLASTHSRSNDSLQESKNNLIENVTGTRESEREDNGTNIGSNRGNRSSETKQNGVTGESSKSNNTETQWNLYSDTPQGGINGIEGTAGGSSQNVGDNYYLTNARKVTGDSENTVVSDGVSSNNVETAENNENNTENIYNNSNKANEAFGNNRFSENDGNIKVTSTEGYIEKISGKRSGLSYSKMLEEFRKTFLNIDKMVVNELNDLFFGLWE